MQLLTAAQMRAIERAAIDGGEATGLELMERAGRGAVEAIFEWRPELAAAPGKAAVLCGPGNNGGDGFVVARLLKGKGWAVEVLLHGEEAKLPRDAAENCRRWREMGEVAPLTEESGGSIRASDLFIDALFGTGLTRPLEGAAAILAEKLGEGGGARRHVAIDAPSGLCMDSGRALGAAFFAELTVTFHRAKQGHFVGDGQGRCGRVKTVDIGLEGHSPSPDADRADIAEVFSDHCPAEARLPKQSAHKYAHGHALVLAGGVGKGGAARLAARGALRIGAGLVTLGSPPAAIVENAARLDAVMLARIADPEALAAALKDERINVVALGPGMGVGEATAAMVRAALVDPPADRGAVLDADALTSFAAAPEDLFALTTGKSVVLTPHLGEFRSVFPDIHGKLTAPAVTGPAYSKIDAAREAAARAGCVVLLKGPDTVVADAERRAGVVSAQYERACPWLATAGAGDVLTGMIAGLLARGFETKPAAETAAWLHQEAAIAFGPGLIAEDIPEMLPHLFRNMRASR